MRRFLLPIILIVFALPVAAQPRPITWLSIDGQKAYQTLLAATQFTIGPAGFAGFSNEESALRMLLNEHDAERACINLVSNANHEGGLYGLLGLRILNSDALPVQLEKYRQRQQPLDRIASGMKVPEGQIISMRGCFILRVGWTETLLQLEAGAFDQQFRRDGKTIAAKDDAQQIVGREPR